MKDSSNTTNSLAYTKWNCKYHIVFAPKYCRKVFCDEHRLEVREILRRLCEWEGVDIIDEVFPEYVANQLKKDKEAGRLSILGSRDSLTGSK